jgi:hypothetical protein
MIRVSCPHCHTERPYAPDNLLPLRLPEVTNYLIQWLVDHNAEIGEAVYVILGTLLIMLVVGLIYSL